MQDTLGNADGNAPSSAVDLVVHDIQKTEAEAVTSFYIHPDIDKKLQQMQTAVPGMGKFLVLRHPLMPVCAVITKINIRGVMRRWAKMTYVI